jgi:ribosomal protein L35AE/L33A
MFTMPFNRKDINKKNKENNMHIKTNDLAKIKDLEVSDLTYKVKSENKCKVTSEELPKVAVQVTCKGKKEHVKLNDKAKKALKYCTSEQKEQIASKLKEIKEEAVEKIKAGRKLETKVAYVKSEKGKVSAKVTGSLHGKEGFVKVSKKKNHEPKIKTDLNKEEKLYTKLVNVANKAIKKHCK